MSSYKTIISGVLKDLDDLFEPIADNSKGANCGYKNQSGIDLSNYYLAQSVLDSSIRVSGSATNYKVGNVDLANIFQMKGYPNWRYSLTSPKYYGYVFYNTNGVCTLQIYWNDTQVYYIQTLNPTWTNTEDGTYYYATITVGSYRYIVRYTYKMGEVSYGAVKRTSV